MDFLIDYMLDPAGAAVVLFALFFGLLTLGTPISIAIGVSSLLVGMVYLPSDVIFFIGAQKMFSGIDSFTLLAIPFFVLAGNIMNKGGIAIRLINLAKLLGGVCRGRLRTPMSSPTCCSVPFPGRPSPRLRLLVV